MSTIVVFSDLQAHPWQEGEVTAQYGRFNDCLRAIDAVTQVAIQEKADCVVFNGDLFESKRLLRSGIAAQVYAALLRMRSHAALKRATFVYNAGNHDYADNDHSLHALLPTAKRDALRVHVCTKFDDAPTRVVLPDGVELLFVPNGMSVAGNTPYTIAFIHGNVTGAAMHHGVACTTQDYPAKFFRRMGTRERVINGHFHSPQTLHATQDRVPIHIVGAPLQHSWSDADDESSRGCMVIRTQPHTQVVRHSFDHLFPKFWTTAQNARASDFVRAKKAEHVTVEHRTHKDAAQFATLTTAEAVRTYTYKAARAAGYTKKDARMLARQALQFLGGAQGGSDVAAT